tara:strand:- start:52 stop:1563 length:1512 start_codon:yes stop_codon:yes gene_type:complete
MGRIGKTLKIKSFKQTMKDKKKLMNEDEILPEHKEFAEWFDKRLDDPFTVDILKAKSWFLEFMGPEDWEKRKQTVLEYFNQMSKDMFEKKENFSYSSGRGKMAVYDDWVAWYLYLAESIELRPMVSEPSQSSRIWHFFATIGKNIEDLKSSKGIESKLYDLLKRKINQPDSILFEFVVATCYLRNGWSVEFIPETGERKTPDLYVTRDNEEYFVECKRLAKVTQYSDEERNEWLKRWEKTLPFLTQYPESVFLDVTFKKEVKETDEDIVAKAFHDMASCGAVAQGFCVENEEVKVCARHINMTPVHEHFDKWMVKYPSAQLHALFDESYEPEGSYTNACQVKLVEVNPDKESVINVYAESVNIAYCAKWECIAEQSIDKKARDVKNLLVKAVKQAPDKGATVVHIGYETLHGPHIEFIRDRKIVDSLSSFDFGEKDIASVFCHSFQSRQFPDNNWDFAETTRCFGFSSKPEDILSENLLMQREESVISDETHWLQDYMEKFGD